MEICVTRCESFLPSLLPVEVLLNHVDVALATCLKAVHGFGKCKEFLDATRMTTRSLNLM
jgi:hypothetical protein